MKNIVIRLKAFGYFFDTLSRATWRRSGSGIVRLMRFAFLMIRATFLTFLSNLFFGRRVRIFMSVYAWFRSIDDRIDGDAPMPTGHTLESYMTEKRRAMRALCDGSEDEKDFPSEDIVLFHLKREVVDSGIAILDEVWSLWEVIELELEIRRVDFLQSADDWHYSAYMQDKAFFLLAGMILDCNRSKLEEISEKMDGIFTELGWFRDLDHDLKKGMVIVPRQAFHGISEGEERAYIQRAKETGFEEIKNNPDAVRWYRQEAIRLFTQWEYMREELGANFGGIFTNKTFARFAQLFINRLADKALSDILERARPLQRTRNALGLQ